MRFELPPLPYPKDALAPHLGAETLEFHYEKHHRGYLTALESLLRGTAAADQALDAIVRSAEGAVFNNAAQVWNHTFYWHSMKPRGGGDPPAELRTALAQAFGSVDGFAQAFLNAAVGQFGSGYAWLVRRGPEGPLAVRATPNAANPLVDGDVPLVTADVWEHAYYLDYRNQRAAYVRAFLEHLVDWEFALANFRGERTAGVS